MGTTLELRRGAIGGMGGQRSVNKRAPRRFMCKGLACSEGRIADLSMGGAMLLRRRPWALGDERDVTLESDRNAPLTFRCRCVWTKREGPWSYSIGITFEGLSGRNQLDLARIMEQHVKAVPERRAA